MDSAAEPSTVFVAYLGDLTENGRPGEFEQIGQAFRYFGTRRAERLNLLSRLAGWLVSAVSFPAGF